MEAKEKENLNHLVPRSTYSFVFELENPLEMAAILTH